MRIAVSGSHSLGKSTVVSDWIARYPDYVREEEPYRALALHGPYEILFRDASTRLHNGIQLYYNIGRVHRYVSAILAFVPQSDSWPVGMEDDGIRPVDHPYRDEVDSIFKQIYREHRFDILPQVNPPLLIELVGPPDDRLLQLSRAVEQRAGLSS